MKRSSLTEGTAWRTAVVPVSLTGADYRRAHQGCHAAALLYNHLIESLRRFWDSEQRDPSTSQLRSFIPTAPDEALEIHAHSKQAIVDDILDSVTTYRANIGAGRQARAPWREKKYRPLEFTADYGWRVDKDGKLSLSLGRGRAPLKIKLPEVTDPTTGESVPTQGWGGLRLCWDRMARQWSVHIAVPRPAPAPGDPDVVMAIDEGIINPMTTAAETEDSYEVTVINGRAARSVKHYRNTRVAELAKLRSRCTPGSRRHRKLSRTMKRLESETAKRLHNIDHQVSRKAADVAEEHNAGTIVAGDVRGIEQGTRQAEKRRTGRHQRRRLSQWSRGRQETLLGHKHKTTVGHIDESYSSKTCPACLARNHPSGRNYQCRECGFVCHRDAVGALNILMRAKHREYTPIDPAKQIRITYLRATPITVARSNAENPATSTAGDTVPIHVPDDPSSLLAVEGAHA